jgi:mitochondrial import receptor subunit TOM40
MASALHAEKEVLVDAHAPLSPLPLKSSYFNPLSPFTDAYDRFARWRADLGLPHPGTVENLQKEVKGTYNNKRREEIPTDMPCTSATHLSNYIFDGARADLTKSLSANPLFQVTQSSYNFGAIFANQKVSSEFH